MNETAETVPADIARRLLDAVERADVDAHLALYGDDITLEFPYATPPRTLSGLTSIRELLTEVHQVFRFRFEIERIHEAGNTAVVEFRGDNRYRSDDAAYLNRYVVIVDVGDDGLIHRHREYYNPTATRPSG